MRIIPNVTLRDDQPKKDYPPGVEADVSDAIANDAIARGLAEKAAGFQVAGVQADPGATAAVDPDDQSDEDDPEDDEAA